MKHLIISLFWIGQLAGGPIFAQSRLDEVLDLVVKNNTAILANNQYIQSQNLAFKTGLAPYNPTIEYDYLKGRPEGAGNQRDFSVTQSFDFPTAYFKKKQLAEEKKAQTLFQAIAFRQDILLETKLYFLELVYLNKQKKMLTSRLQNMESLSRDYQRKFEQGEANILDVNKIKVQLVALQNELHRNNIETKQFTERLIRLSGGTVIIVNDTIYPLLSQIPEYATMDSLVESNDPLLKVVRQEREISLKEKALTRALSLPKAEVGYHYQSILGQVYEGIHLGVSIPLWQDQNKVKQLQAQILYNELQIQNHRTGHLYEIKELYQRYENLKVRLAEFDQLLSTLNSVALLDKALQLGQISTIEYFMELTYFYHSFDTYLLLEKEYNQVVAELYKFTL